nr:hypothetical protein [Rhodoferax sp.]
MPSNRGASPQKGQLDRILFNIYKMALLALAVLVAVSTVLLSVTGVYIFLSDQGGDQTVRATQDAGRVLDVTTSSGLLTRSLVETTLGYFALADGISLYKGEDLTLQTRANGRRYLCDAGHRCTPIL